MAERAELLCMTFQRRGHRLLLTFSKQRARCISRKLEGLSERPTMLPGGLAASSCARSSGDSRGTSAAGSHVARRPHPVQFRVVLCSTYPTNQATHVTRGHHEAHVKTPVTRCTPGAVVGGVHHGDVAGPPLLRSPARLRPLGRHGGRASLRSRRGPQTRHDRASRRVDRPRRARCDAAACRRTRGTAVRAWAAGADEDGRRRAGHAARTAAGLWASEHQALERTRGCHRTRPTSSIPLRAGCGSTSGTTCWARGRASSSRCCGPRRAPRLTKSGKIQPTHRERLGFV